jgi:hypothetical protein
MVTTHGTSIVYEIRNMFYHVVEQGIGGVIIYYTSNYFKRKILN